MALPDPRSARPALLTAGMVLSGFVGSLALLFLLLAPFDIGTYTMDGETVTGPEFLRTGGILFIVTGGLLLAIGITLVLDNDASRELMIAFWLVTAAPSTLVPLLKGTSEIDLTWLPAFGIAIWYLYFKKNVVAYYAASGGQRHHRLPFESPKASSDGVSAAATADLHHDAAPDRCPSRP